MLGWPRNAPDPHHAAAGVQADEDLAPFERVDLDVLNRVCCLCHRADFTARRR